MKFSLFFIFCFCCSFLGKAQNGLEGILVEKYYIASDQDTVLNSYLGQLVPGSTTYRIYADLLPGYRLQAVYGTKKHPLHINSTTFFYNNSDLGNTTPTVLPRKALKKNTLMLDSWLTVGTAAEEFLGIPKDDDDTLYTVKHDKGFLKNKTKKTGFALEERDGFVNSPKVPKVTLFGLGSLVDVFDKKCIGGDFYVDNGAWASMGEGVVGADSLTKNRVLIAQLTTDGILDFELNIQIGTPNGEIQNFVARNPEGNEILQPALIYSTHKTKRKKK